MAVMVMLLSSNAFASDCKLPALVCDVTSEQELEGKTKLELCKGYNCLMGGSEVTRADGESFTVRLGRGGGIGCPDSQFVLSIGTGSGFGMDKVFSEVGVNDPYKVDIVLKDYTSGLTVSCKNK